MSHRNIEFDPHYRPLRIPVPDKMATIGKRKDSASAIITKFMEGQLSLDFAGHTSKVSLSKVIEDLKRGFPLRSNFRVLQLKGATKHAPALVVPTSAFERCRNCDGRPVIWWNGENLFLYPSCVKGQAQD